MSTTPEPRKTDFEAICILHNKMLPTILDYDFAPENSMAALAAVFGAVAAIHMKKENWPAAWETFQKIALVAAERAVRMGCDPSMFTLTTVRDAEEFKKAD